MNVMEAEQDCSVRSGFQMIDFRNSIILLDKPTGQTSYDIVNKTKRLLNERKIGHAGTLDKAASGLLVLCTGKATKLTRYFLENDKQYIADIKLGIITDSGDREGVIREQRPVKGINEERIQKTVNKFRGKIRQAPPVYSALKIRGKRASDLARNGKTVELSEREVTIHHVEITDIELESASFTIDVTCSKGTYIRSLACDIGKELGTGAYLEGLRRIRSGIFSINDAATIQELEDFIATGGESSDFIKSPSEALHNYSSMMVNSKAVKRVLHGAIFQRGDVIDLQDSGEKIFIIYDENKNLIAIADVDIQKWHIKYQNVFN